MLIWGTAMRFILLFVMWACMAWGIELGKVPPVVTIGGTNGGKVSGGRWCSSTLTGKVHALFYVDPDKKDLNEAFAERLKRKHYPASKAASVVVVNMAATWKPNFILNAILKAKQKKYPRALYVKDLHKVMVKKWHLADDDYNVLLFDKKGKLIFKKAGKMSKADMDRAIALIEKNL